MTREKVIKLLRKFVHQFDGRDVEDAFVEDVLESAADMLEQDAQGWISVKDRMPEYGRYLVTVVRDDGAVAVHTATYNDLGWWMHSNAGEITHWMPLPEPPKEEKHGE